MIASSGGSPVVQIIGESAASVWLISGYLYRWRLSRSAAPTDNAATDKDPGWGPAFARASMPFRRRRSVDGDPLTAARLIFVGLAIAFPLFLLAFSFSTPWNGGDAGIAPWVVTGAGLLSLTGIAWVRRRPLNMATESGLAGQFRTAMFLGIGFAEIPGLLGVVMILITGSLWIYVIGLAFSLLDLVLIGPTRTEIARRQRQIAAAHQPHDLTRALMRKPDPPR